MFIDRPGLATSGAVAVRAFHDRDGDGTFSSGDLALPDVDFAFNAAATTDDAGFARLAGLGDGTPVTVQIDPASLPDIAMSPAQRGVQIVPRPGRLHVTAFPVVELSEVEGNVSFAGGGNNRGVSGLRLQLRPVADGSAGEVTHTVRTERGGYFFFEQVRPGAYAMVIEPEQAARLGICLEGPASLLVPAQGAVIQQDLTVSACGPGTQADPAQLVTASG